MKRKIFIIILLFTYIGCSSILIKKNEKLNISKLSVEEQEYLRYQSEFNYNDTYPNMTVKYFEGSYSEGQSSSFEPSIPSGPLTMNDVKKYNTYFKVIYSDGKQVKGVGVTNGKVNITIYYDMKGRIIKKYYHANDTFYFKKYYGEKYCIKRNLTREEDAEEYKEPEPIFVGQ